MIDAHCHLDSPQFEQLPDLDNLEAVITAGGDLESSKRNVELANKHSNVFVCVGLGYEPKYKNWNSLRKELLDLIKNKKVVGIGECGLDSDNVEEEELLKFHLDIARETDLPLVVHNRRQDTKIIKILGDYSKVMMHCFTSDKLFMTKCIKRRWYMSFGGILTFKKSRDLRDLVARVPAELLLVETDSPYLTPEPIRGGVNQPQNVKIVAEMMAKARAVSVGDIDYITTQNTKNLFKI